MQNFNNVQKKIYSIKKLLVMNVRSGCGYKPIAVDLEIFGEQREKFLLHSSAV